jgi:hypothetical protein
MEEPSAVQMPLIKGRAVAAFPIWILVFSVLAMAFGAVNQDSAETKIDYAFAQQDILKFELVVNDVINSTFSSSPFAVVQKAKGAYLPGYGISLSFLINIHTAVINTPFGQIQRRAEVSPEMKKKRIEELKDKLIRVLQDNGDNFRQLRKEDNVTIVAFIEDRNFPDEPSANRTIVLSAFKRDLDELGRKTDRVKEFRQRMKIVEY